MIPYGRQHISDEDIQAVIDTLKSDRITQGSKVPELEENVAKRCNANFGVACNSGTSALHLACKALDLGPGEYLWTSPNTFVASANCALYCNANVDFVDIDPFTWNMSIDSLTKKLKQAYKNKRLPKIVVPVHFAGQPTDQEVIWELAQEFGFRVLEDASHALGASRNGEPVGSCRWSDITVFSFHPVKIITTGEGGMALTNDEELAWRMQMYRTHGITRDPDKIEQTNSPPWYYEQQMLGFNYRMTDLQAALGISQLKRLNEFVNRRNQLAERYNEAFKGLPVQLSTVQPENRSSYHLYVIRLKRKQNQKTHRQIFEELRARGIGVNLHYMPVHLQPYYQNLGFAPGSFPEAEAHGDEAITLPLYPTLTEEDQKCVINFVIQVIADE